MATLDSVGKKINKLIEKYELSIEHSEEELLKILRNELAGRGKSVRTTMTISEGITVTRECRSIFPEFVKVPDYSNSRKGPEWVVDHCWGVGSNEGEGILLEILKEALVLRAGLSERVSWGAARCYPLGNLKEVSGRLKTDCGRGPRSPYSQDFRKEFELALEFGVEVIMRWHGSMHWKGWAGFVDQIHALWKRWGVEAIREVDSACGERIRWFARFAGEKEWQYDPRLGQSELMFAVPENWGYKQALRAWKRANWVYAVSGVSSEKLAVIDRIYGGRKVDNVLRNSQDRISVLPETHKAVALDLLLNGEPVEWRWRLTAYGRKP